MTEEKKDPQDPKKPEGDKTLENKPGEGEPEVPGEGTEGEPKPEGEKTPEQEQITTLTAQKKHQREKREEAEEKNRILEEENAKLRRENLPTPSDKELAEKHPDWELKTDEERNAIRKEEERFRKDEERERRLRKLEEKEAWDNDYANVLKDFPQLKERQAEFKEFAYKKENRGTKNLATLAKAFLFEEKEEPEPEKPKPKEPETPKKKGLEQPTAGDGKAPGPEMSLADIKRLRETNYKKYSKMVREGRIKDIPEE